MPEVAYSRIAERLMYEFTDEVAATIREQIESGEN